MEANQIKKMIGTIGKGAAKLAAQVQLCAIECLIHAVNHGDITLAQHLIEALGKGGRKATLFAWFELYGPFVVSQGKLTYRKEPLEALKNEGDAAIRARLKDVLWTEAKAEAKAVSVVDVNVEFDKFMKRIHKIATEGTIELKNKGMLEALESFSNHYQNEQAIKAISALEPEELARVYGLRTVNA